MTIYTSIKYPDGSEAARINDMLYEPQPKQFIVIGNDSWYSWKQYDVIYDGSIVRTIHLKDKY